MNRWIVLRKPNLQEDEGRYQLIGTFDNKEEAEERIVLEAHRSKGYFSAWDYVALEVPK